MPLFGPTNIDKLKAKGDIKGLIKLLHAKKDRAVYVSAMNALIEILIDTLKRGFIRPNGSSCYAVPDGPSCSGTVA